MRALISKGEEERRRKKNQTILVVILAFIMVASTLGFAIQSNSGDSGNPGVQTDTVRYGDYEFVNQNGLWVLGNFVFRNLPQQVPDIGFGMKTAENYQGKPAYVYSEDADSEAEIAINLGQIAQRIQKACPENTICTEDLPVKTCSDNFIIIKESSNSSITQENNCVYIQGEKAQLTALADQFLFKTLGIK